MSSLIRVGSVVLTAFAVLAPSASGSTVLTTSARSDGSWLRKCHAKLLRPGSTTQVFKATAADTGLLHAKVRGTADWDLAIFGAGGRFVAAAAGPTNTDIAQGFVAKGEQLAVQACAARGGRSAVSLRVDTIPLPLRDAGHRVRILSVRAPSHEDRNRLMALGFDDTHSGTKDTLDIVVSGPEEIAKLRAAGFTWTVMYGDLIAKERERALADAEFARTTRRSALPSGRTAYRQLADYEAELKLLAEKHPGLVKLITMPHKSLEGRAVMGVEIAQNVHVPDGKPVFFQMGIHHAREWPAAEHPMEWAHELVAGYGKNERVTRLVNSTRTIVVPVVNPDGFNLSRTAPVDPGNAAAMVDLPPDVDDELPLSDPTYTAVLIADPAIGSFAYKRRNCRVKDGEVPKEGECASRDNRDLGADPNRNYGGFWGGPGASVDPTSDTYRGGAAFSEPETQNVRETISSHQVVTMITSHTFSNLVLRPPGIKNEGTTPDDPAYKALGDAMAAQNGYTSQHGYQLYDTTGTTEDWSYFATGGFGFTFEIGPDEFHPPFEEMVAEYDGVGPLAGKGNREAYFIAQEHTANAKHHSVLTGKAPAATVLRVHKDFMSSTSPGDQGRLGPDRPPAALQGCPGYDHRGRPLRSVRVAREPVDAAVRAERPRVRGRGREAGLRAGHLKPRPGPAGRARGDRVRGQARRGAPGACLDDERRAGLRHVLVLREGQRRHPGGVERRTHRRRDDLLRLPGARQVHPADRELLGGRALRGQARGVRRAARYAGGHQGLQGSLDADLRVARRQRDRHPQGRGRARRTPRPRGRVPRRRRHRGCAQAGRSVKKAKKLKARKILRKGLAATAKCSRECTLSASLQLNKKAAKKLKLSTTLARTKKPVTFTGKRGLRLKLGGRAAKRLRRARMIKASLVVIARDRLGNVRSKTVRVVLRR